MPTNKIIVTNLTALQNKYGAGFQRVQAAVTSLIAADATRGLTTVLIGLDDKAAMGGAKSPVVTDPGDASQNKAAIDALYTYFTPDYIMILGAVDIVPHQDLVNPVSGDPDETVPSDLPYSCLAPYGTEISAFKNPVRVVGRLPDVTGGSDPTYLEALLSTSAQYASKPAATYKTYLGVSAGVWTSSTSQTLAAIFGQSTAMKVVPPAGHAWQQADLNAPSHYFNCHGNTGMPQYFGQPADGSEEYPAAHDAAYLEDKIKPGTVLAAECCYGAQLYSPAQVKVHQAIANQYLQSGAYGVFGSTTIAYGPSDSNDQADLICRYFFQSLLTGASLGRSALEARQTYVLHKSNLGPTDLKTIAQYILLGDPSVTPVAAAAQPGGAHLVTSARALVPVNPTEKAALERKARRTFLIQNGLAIGESVSTSGRQLKGRIDPKILKLLRQESRNLKLVKATYASFGVKPAPVLAAAKVSLAKAGGAKPPANLGAPTSKAVYLAIGRVGKKSTNAVNLAGVEVLEFKDGVTIRRFVSR